PRHIAQMAEAVRGLAPPPRRPLTPVHVVTREETTAGALPPERNAVAEVFASVPFIISVEMRPDRQTPLQTFLEAGQRLARQGVHLFDVPDNAGAKVAVDPMVAASRLQQATCIPSLIHLGTSHRNLVATQSYLLGAWYLGIQGILAVTGDHPNVGDHDKYATRVNDIKSSVNLMRLIRSLNEGQLFNRAACARCQFVVGGGFNPGRGLTAQVKWLERKIEAGCSFVYTQPVFRRQEIDQMQEAVAHLNIPILVGILPLTSRRNAEFFAAGKIPGIIVPPEILARFEHVESPQDGRRLGLDMAIELIQQLRPQIRGIYIIPPFGPDRYGMVAEILEAIRSPEGVAAGPAA
ncbi:MAG TPA: methylenetetrahydrofolate reductase, partial [Candidatus Nitrosotenuis sp.]|nr:methylenetetrahydrofolate reductase [Candidatus Nitrosotenuis sp.]